MFLCRVEPGQHHFSWLALYKYLMKSCLNWTGHTIRQMPTSLPVQPSSRGLPLAPPSGGRQEPPIVVDGECKFVNSTGVEHFCPDGFK